MRVFVTGSTGFIGSAVVPELIKAGHLVLGLARSDAGAAALAAAGADVLRGHLEDLDGLRAGAGGADGVIHLGYVHDFARYADVGRIDREAIEAMGDALAASGRPGDRAMVVTAGLFLGNGEVATEDMNLPADYAIPRFSEPAALQVAARGVRACVVRLPQVHDTRKQGLVTYLIDLARRTGVSAYIGDGLNSWPACHVLDTAPLYRLALEKGEAGARYHAVSEEGVTGKAIAEAIGRGLNIPVVSQTREEAAAHFGWLAMFAGEDGPATSTLTQSRLGWRPTQPASMIDDLDHMDWAAVARGEG